MIAIESTVREVQRLHKTHLLLFEQKHPGTEMWWVARAKTAMPTMINAQTVPHRRPNKEVEESKHTGSLLPFSLFSSILIHPSPRQCASSERNLEQIACGVHPPLPFADLVFFIHALFEALPNILQNH